MTVLGLVVCVIAIAVVENEQYKDLRDRNKRQGLAYGLSLFFFAIKTSNIMKQITTNTNLKEIKTMKKMIRNLTICVLTMTIAIVGCLYANDFRYDNEKGLYYITKRYEDLSEEQRESGRYSDDYTSSITHLEDTSVNFICNLLMES